MVSVLDDKGKLDYRGKVIEAEQSNRRWQYKVLYEMPGKEESRWVPETHLERAT
jgi:hypothetical protein